MIALWEAIQSSTQRVKTAAHHAGEQPADNELVMRARAGDMRALEALLRRHGRTLYRAARAILRDDAEAEDAVQEACIRAYRSLNTFRGEAKFSTWLVRIAMNAALMRRRRAASRREVVPLDADMAVHTEQGDSMLRRLLQRSIDALPDRYRAVFILRALKELSVDETAALLRIPEATARTRYFRARGLLRRWLARGTGRTLEARGNADARAAHPMHALQTHTRK